MRFPVAGTVALGALAVVLAGCGSSDGAGATDGSAAWSFKDGRGTTVKVDHRPKRIVAQGSIAAALQDDGVDVVGAFGPVKGPDGGVSPQSAGLDLSKVTDVTASGDYGSLDEEKLVGLDPDLVVTNMFVPPELWYINAATEKKIEKLVPTLAIDFQDKGLVDTIESVEKVAVALGGDPDATKAGKAAFDAASDRLRKVATALGSKQILVTSATTDLLYAGDPAGFPDLRYYESLGLKFAAAKAGKDGYWEELSWENSDKYDADIVMWDSRDGDGLLKLLKAQPVFGQITGAKNGAYVPWEAVAPPSYRAYARVMNTLADNLEKQV